MNLSFQKFFRKQISRHRGEMHRSRLQQHFHLPTHQEGTRGS